MWNKLSMKRLKMNYSDYVIFHTIVDQIGTFNPRKTWEHVIGGTFGSMSYSDINGDRRIEYYPESSIQTHYKYSSPSDW